MKPEIGRMRPEFVRQERAKSARVASQGRTRARVATAIPHPARIRLGPPGAPREKRQGGRPSRRGSRGAVVGREERGRKRRLFRRVSGKLGAHLAPWRPARLPRCPGARLRLPAPLRGRLALLRLVNRPGQAARPARGRHGQPLHALAPARRARVDRGAREPLRGDAARGRDQGAPGGREAGAHPGSAAGAARKARTSALKRSGASTFDRCGIPAMTTSCEPGICS